MSALRLALVLTLVVGAAVAANVALLTLGGRHEPVGRLTPIADVGPLPTGVPETTEHVRPTVTEHEREEDD